MVISHDSAIARDEFRNEVIEMHEIFQACLLRILRGEMLGMIEPGKIDRHQARELQLCSFLGSTIEMLE